MVSTIFYHRIRCLNITEEQSCHKQLKRLIKLFYDNFNTPSTIITIYYTTVHSLSITHYNCRCKTWNIHSSLCKPQYKNCSPHVKLIGWCKKISQHKSIWHSYKTSKTTHKTIIFVPIRYNNLETSWTKKNTKIDKWNA